MSKAVSLNAPETVRQKEGGEEMKEPTEQKEPEVKPVTVSDVLMLASTTDLESWKVARAELLNVATAILASRVAMCFGLTASQLGALKTEIEMYVDLAEALIASVNKRFK
jgi:hypothetical protein